MHGHNGGVVLLRVRYRDTGQMGTYSSARALEWFECGRPTGFSRLWHEEHTAQNEPASKDAPQWR